MEREWVEISVPKYEGFKFLGMGKIKLHDIDKHFIQVDKCFYPYSGRKEYLMSNPELGSNGLPLDIGVCFIYMKID